MQPTPTPKVSKNKEGERYKVCVFLTATIIAAAIPNNPPPTTTSTKIITSTITSVGTTTIPVTTTVVVTPPPSTVTVGPNNQCNVGSLKCCESVQTALSADATKLFGLLGIVLSDLSVLVGITCSALEIIGISGTSCSAQPVCCENDQFNGVIAIGCTPININL